jgi:hypothetical protein
MREFLPPPSVAPFNGSGTKARYSFEDVCRAVMFKMLIEQGFTRKAASKYLKRLTDDMLRKDATFRVLIDLNYVRNVVRYHKERRKVGDKISGGIK